jgi:hypothetical protein
MEITGPTNEILYNQVRNNKIVGRVGQIGKWDNGLYVTGLIQEVPVHVFWVDSGSTTKLISYNVFMRFWCKPTLNISNSVIKDVNGENLKVYGTVQIKINFEKETFEHSVIICDILAEGILGQDFVIVKECEKN